MLRSEGESDCDELPYELILQRSSLARGLKSVFSNLSTSGIVNIVINKWIQVRFCLPQKVHQSHKKGLLIDPEIVDRYALYDIQLKIEFLVQLICYLIVFYMCNFKCLILIS